LLSRDIKSNDKNSKIMFLNIKNKFRFATVSLLLASFVTVVSSTSAFDADADFSFFVPLTYNCAEVDSPASWLVELDPASDGLEIGRGSQPNITAYTGFEDGYTECADGSMDVNGTVSSVLAIAGVDGEIWNTVSDCDVSCTASSAVTFVRGQFTVPETAEEVKWYYGTLSLQWTPAL
jgi:hypothetical protein